MTGRVSSLGWKNYAQKDHGLFMPGHFYQTMSYVELNISNVM